MRAGAGNAHTNRMCVTLGSLCMRELCLLTGYTDPCVYQLSRTFTSIWRLGPVVERRSKQNKSVHIGSVRRVTGNTSVKAVTRLIYIKQFSKVGQ